MSLIKLHSQEFITIRVATPYGFNYFHLTKMTWAISSEYV